MTTAFPASIEVDGTHVAIKRVPLHPGYGAGADGHLYTFYHPEVAFGYFDYGLPPRRKARIRKRGDATGAATYHLERAWDQHECGCLIKGTWEGYPRNPALACTRRINDDPEDYRPCNLLWCTLSDKLKATGRDTAGVSNGNARLNEDDVRFIRRYASRISSHRIASLFEITRTHATYIVQGKVWKAVRQATAPPTPLPARLDGEAMREVPGAPGLCITADGARLVRFMRSIDQQGWDATEYRELTPWGDPPVVHPSGKRRNVPVVVLGCKAFAGPRPGGNCKATWSREAGFAWVPTQAQAGERNASAKLTWKQVAEIRSRPHATRSELARQYECSVSTIRNIRAGTSWADSVMKEVPEQEENDA